MLRSGLVCAAFAALSLGCDSGGPTKDYAFNPGKGVVEGAVPENAVITFIPKDDSSFVARGDVRDGKFELTTHFSKPVKTTPGVPEGKYQVRINVPNTTKEIGPPALPDSLQVKQSDSPIKVAVKK